MEVANSRDTGLRGPWLVSVGAALIGLVDSTYLAWIKIADQTAACSGIGDCESVNNSIYSEIGGIPIALIGAVAYFVIFLLLLLEKRFRAQSMYLRFSVFGLSLAGTLYSGYLTYLEIAVIRAICPFCALSAITIFVLLIMGIIRLKADFAALE